MGNITLVLTSDWHCDDYAWARYPSLCGDSLFALEQIVDHCIRVKAVALLAAGDLTNTPNPSPSAQQGIHLQMDRLQHEGIECLFTQGQHERNTEFPRLSVHLWPQWMHKRVFELQSGVKLVGLDWTPPSRLKAELEWVTDQKAAILMCHQVWHQFMGSICDTEGDLRDCTTPIVLTGDYHKHLRLQLCNFAGHPIDIFSPGSMSMRSIDEEPQKKIFVIEMAANGDLVSVKDVPLKCRRCDRLLVENEDALCDLIDDVDELSLWDTTLPADLQKPIIQVKYDVSIPNAYPRLVEAFRDKAHLFLAVVGEKEKRSATDRAATAALLEQGMVGCLKSMSLDWKTMELAEDILRSPSPEEVLNNLKTNMLAEVSA